jgi:hypothetical protein
MKWIALPTSPIKKLSIASRRASRGAEAEITQPPAPDLAIGSHLRHPGGPPWQPASTIGSSSSSATPRT